MDIIDTDSWYEIAAFASCYGHHVGTDTFITHGYTDSKTESQIGYFKHYTVTDLIDKTKDLLGGQEMSEDQKSMYGIG